jgi:D-glycero-D-manno-heptose 1,7-bisphosphate phosphatase
MRPKPAVFLDRDGVLNADSDEYIKSWAEFTFYPGVFAALRRLREAGCEVYLVTNQQGVGKGLLTHRTLLDILLRLRLTVREHGGLIHGVAYCRHLKTEGCACRKPKPGMLHKLAMKYGLDLARSVFVGDSCTDVECGQAVGCATILLHTRPEDLVRDHVGRCTTPPDHQARDLAEAVDIILRLPQFEW